MNNSVKLTDNIIAYNMDCIEFMKDKPDKYWDLAIIDPPYGLERHKRGDLRIKKVGVQRGVANDENIDWDIKPTQEYFNELFRVSKYQIIWGANNFTLPETEYFIVWDKQQTVDNFASAEYAWTNCPIPAKVFTYSIHKTIQDRKKEGNKFHPTQKPITLYRWLLQNYAKPNDKILDTHGGSMSIAIACDMESFGLDICELDKDYFDKAIKRFNNYKVQQRLF